MNHVDVLVVTAIPEELKAARDVASDRVARWEPREVDKSSPYIWGEYRVDGGRGFTVALARPLRMGGRAAGPFVTTLVDRLQPSSVVMCGVCGGNPAETALGDVVVGSPVYEWDEGQRSSDGFAGNHQQFPLDSDWQRAAQEFSPADLDSYGEIGEEEALLWFLELLHHGQEPRNHPAREQYFPAGTWKPRLARLVDVGWIRRERGASVLTAEGIAHLAEAVYDDVDGPQRLPYRVLESPMASGSAVSTDADEWDRLKAMGALWITAIDMEAATIATVAHAKKLPWMVVKGVSDYADALKGHRYKRFAARAAAQVMFALLERVAPRNDAEKLHTSSRGGEHIPRRPKPTTTTPIDPVAAEPTSMEQQNAVRMAESYLGHTAFSREGLIKQLVSAEGFSKEAATAAVDSLGADYDEQAAESAKSYLSHTAFSRKGLIKQLVSAEGFSKEAATNAVNILDVDYDEQAAKSAATYLSHSAFSRRGLIEQLEYEGFTESQAVHGAGAAGL
ncbi:Ltp family lipoprotein [Symbioplanes lichenis]|uniref:Ltp family lipoprotein n=1 Tax=Symbioplanes lichenis TaxID=1629072 RepID=UPI002739788A|nr:Ltp family lipoprotein [Actinoplanes lichenis]